MGRMFTVVLMLLLCSGPALSQLYQGPAAGSVPSGAVTTTDNFESEGPNAPAAIEQRVHVHQDIPLLPLPANAPAPTGPEGSNYIVDPAVTAGILTPPPITIVTFPGIPDAGTSIPPDPYMAAGPNHIIVVVNSSFRICDKSGKTLKTISAPAWFNNVFSGNGAFDPKVQYDHFAGRWIMVWLQQSDTGKTSNYLLSVSDDSNPLGTWYSWALPGNRNGDSVVTSWADYQGVGFDNQAIYLTSNQFAFTSGTSQYVRVRIIPKAQLYANTAGRVTWTDFWDLRDPNSVNNRVFGTRPVRVFGSPGEYYLVSTSVFSPGTYLTLYRIINPLSATPVITGTSVPVVQYSSPPNANQLGGSTTLIEAGGSNIRNEPVYMDSSVWVVHCVRSGTGSSYSSVRYVRISTVTNSAIEDDALGADGYWEFYPALAVDKDENIAITFSRSGLTEYIGAYMTWRLSSDPPGLRPSVAIQPGKANYVKTFSSTRNRWGDYNAAVIDPSDQNNFWMFTEYAESPANTWATWVHNTRLVPFQGARINMSTASINQGSVEAGHTSDTATVTVFNTGSNALSISSISNSQTPFKILSAPTLPTNLVTYDSLQFKVVFRPTGQGVVNDTVMLTCNDPTNPTAKIALLAKGVVIGRAQLGVMYAASTSLPTSKLYSINVATGAATPIGETGITELQGLAIRPSTREIYGTLSTPTSTTFYRVANAFGDALPARTIPLGNIRAIAFGRGDTLYGGTTLGRLYRINLESRDTVFIGTAPGIAYSSLAVNPITGVLWASVRPTIVARDRIYTVNTSNGDTTLVGATGLNAITPHIAFSPTGKLYALIGTSTQTNTIYTLDTLTGAATLVGSTNIQGLLSMTTLTDTLTTSVQEQPTAQLPRTYDLHQNFPNPFNPTTSIRFQIANSNWVRLKVYDLLGKEVATLVDEAKTAGSYQVTFDASRLASGMYLYRLTSGDFVATKKLLLLR